MDIPQKNYSLLRAPLLHRQCFPARTQYVSIFNRHLVRFIRLFLDPVNGLVRAGELADTADLPPVEVLEPAVGATFGAVQFRYGYPFTVELFAFLENLIRANLRTEITTLAPGLVNGEFHEKRPIVYYCSAGEKNLFLISFSLPDFLLD